VIFKTRWIEDLILSSIFIPSSAERADGMLFVASSASFFVSPLALYVRLILSLRNFMDVNAGTLSAVSVGTGGRTCKSLRSMWFILQILRNLVSFTEQTLVETLLEIRNDLWELFFSSVYL